MKFKNFTDRARQVMIAAEREARRFNHHYIGTEHVLLGLLGEDSGIVAETLSTFGVKGENVRREMEGLVERGSTEVGVRQLPLTSRARRAIEIARSEAGHLQCREVDAEHLFVGLLLERDGVAGKVLGNLGLRIEKVGAEVFEVRLEQMRVVERVVRPVRAGVPGKRKMREELLAHLTAIYEEEKARLHDSAAAISEAKKRFGNPQELSRELERALPKSERWSHWIGHYLTWRAPESAGRYCLRLILGLSLFLTCILGPLIAWVILGGARDEAAYWIALRMEAVVLMLLPATVGLLTWLYIKLRDAMWGAFGSPKSARRVGFFAGVIGIVTFLETLVFYFVLGAWRMGEGTYRADLCAMVAVSCAGFYLILAQLSGPTEISDTMWGCLKLD